MAIIGSTHVGQVAGRPFTTEYPIDVAVRLENGDPSLTVIYNSHQAFAESEELAWRKEFTGTSTTGTLLPHLSPAAPIERHH